ncbi:response regulator transcription factor [Advenella mimigardefordensis]|uniref:Putative two-component transcriptional regulator, AraC family n=1 Tax=Advenella mimigardefordensis (strain DSM 17166 / LMG 22922 / DPN7) TaxID=1247726 RepID=W0PK37_ADVMD|nr:DNA-binding response regulator [Advenella mimigardefordensis]AHG65915.1 putative two-component transcriptional regulator, AraC family [Advenella mimigardefordensis DPN7]
MDSPALPLRSLHALFVDGNMQSLHGVLAAMRSAAFRITVAFDGLQGYEKAITTRPDVIVSELHLPRLDGIPLCRRLKANTLTTDIPVLFYSDLNDPQTRIQALEYGASDFISKSHPYDEVVARIRIHAGISQRLQGARQQSALMPLAPDKGLNTDTIVSDDEVAVRIVMQYAQENLAEDLSLPKLSALVSMNKKRLNRAFNNICGCSAFEYIRDLRMRTAKHLLATTSLRTLTIAEDVGFSNAANFATAFLNVQGMTPSEYRRKTRQLRVSESVKNTNDV